MRVILIILAFLVIFVSSCGNSSKEKPRMPEGFPNDVYVKFIQMYPRAELSKYDSREGNNGMLYEVTAEEDNQTIIILFTEEGAVLSERRITPVDSDELPNNIIEAVGSEHPGNEVLSASKVSVNNVIEYHVVVRAMDESEYRIICSVTGEIKQQEPIVSEE